MTQRNLWHPHTGNFLVILTSLISHKDFLKFQAGFAQRLMVVLVERRKDSYNPRVFPEEMKEVKIVDGGTNDTARTLSAVTT